ncbi:hypothetical protein ACFE04_002228 [Oxalis oulophora]
MAMFIGPMNLNCVRSLPLLPYRYVAKAVQCLPLQQEQQVEALSGIMCEPCEGKGWLLCDFCQGQKTNVKAENKRIYRRCPSCRARIHSAYAVNLIYPGSEVPDWFLHQTMGPLIFVKLYPQPNESLFLGFVVCAVVEFAGCLHDKEFTLRYTCVLTLRDQNKVVNECETRYLSYWFDGSSSINSDHVLIGYKIMLPSYFKKNAYIEATVVCFTANGNDSQNWYPLECCKVKKCGIRPMYCDQH